MPILKVTQGVRSGDELIDRIVAAMRAPVLVKGEPEIYLGPEHSRIPGKHLYVVWNGWGDLEFERRAEVVFEAYKQFAPADVQNVTLVMGITPAEWRRMGLESAQGTMERSRKKVARGA
jgi:hypothetical protein